jgi:hypothetical protein
MKKTKKKRQPSRKKETRKQNIIIGIKKNKNLIVDSDCLIYKK